MNYIIIILIISSLLYVCDLIEQKDPAYWRACRGMHPVLRFIIAPVFLLLRLFDRQRAAFSGTCRNMRRSAFNLTGRQAALSGTCRNMRRSAFNKGRKNRTFLFVSKKRKSCRLAQSRVFRIFIGRSKQACRPPQAPHFIN